jgi:hypothetical protein
VVVPKKDYGAGRSRITTGGRSIARRSAAPRHRRHRALRRIAGVTPVTSTIESTPGAPAVPRRRLPVAWAVAALMTLIAVGLGWAWIVDRQGSAARPLHLAIPPTPSEGLEGRFALSHDGQRLAFIGHSEGRAKLYLRALDSTEAVAMGPVACPLTT